MKTQAADKILMQKRTGIAPNVLQRKRPKRIVTPMQIIIAGKITTLFSSVRLSSLVYL